MEDILQSLKNNGIIDHHENMGKIQKRHHCLFHHSGLLKVWTLRYPIHQIFRQPLKLD